MTAASMPGAWLALIAADVAVSLSTTGLPAPGCGAMSDGLNIFTRPWLLPHSSAAVIISAWTSAASSSQPIMRSACAVVDRASFTETVTVSAAAARWRTVHDTRVRCAAARAAWPRSMLVALAVQNRSMRSTVPFQWYGQTPNMQPSSLKWQDCKRFYS